VRVEKVCCSVLWCVAVRPSFMLSCVAACCSVLQFAAVCCSVLWCVAVRPSFMLSCVAACRSVLQFAAVCCSVLQCVAVEIMPCYSHRRVFVRVENVCSSAL